MNWYEITTRDVVWFLIVIASLCAAVFLYFERSKTNEGFGPEWECTNPYNTGPICIKRSSNSEPQQMHQTVDGVTELATPPVGWRGT